MVQAPREWDGDDRDTGLTILRCVQLFNAGFLPDVLLIWQARESSWDAL
jgi:hypothetical protein